MKNTFFQSLETQSNQSTICLNTVFDHIVFNHDGLIPVITQDATSQEVLMMAWMNKSSIQKTLDTQNVTYWSRSRQKYWVKGETSGNTQKLVSMSLDCDGDAILCQVNQVGGACHTGRANCFYLHIDPKNQCVTIQGEHQA
jgi:phosphoribosyl-AMP cyclohydrolase